MNAEIFCKGSGFSEEMQVSVFGLFSEKEAKNNNAAPKPHASAFIFLS
ncbi:hypothetical protein [Rufibacter roseus]|nr:hypothetical protein [Rufibacter roseus]